MWQYKEHKTKGNEVVNSIKEGEKDQDEAGTVGHTYNPRIQMSEAGGS